VFLIIVDYFFILYISTDICRYVPQRRHSSISKWQISLVLLAVVRKDQVLQLDLNLDPFLIAQRRPDVMRLRDGRLVRLEYHLRPVVVDVHGTQDQNEPTERRVRRDRLQPIIVQVEQHHLRLGRLQYQVAELLHLTITTHRLLTMTLTQLNI